MRSGGCEAEDSGHLSILEYCWWSLITITTIGYGIPKIQTPGGKIVGALCAISGVPLFAGFFSKDMILLAAFQEYSAHQSGAALFAAIALPLAAMLTAGCSPRQDASARDDNELVLDGDSARQHFGPDGVGQAVRAPRPLFHPAGSICALAFSICQRRWRNSMHKAA